MKTVIFLKLSPLWIALTPINLMPLQIINHGPYRILSGAPIILTEKTIIAG